MKKKITTIPGDIIKIPLPDMTLAYARIIKDGSYAIYDYKTNEITDISKIVEKNILFFAWVDVFALEEKRWTIVGNLPLEEKLKDFVPRYFMPTPTNPSNIGFYEVYKNEVETAIKNDWIGDSKMQLGGLHGRAHVEARIIDYYAGKRNADNRNSIMIFKKILNLPLENI